jgi:valyl-tRNA synthetase
MIQDIIRAIRNLRSEKNVKPSQKLAATFVSAENYELVKREIKTLSSLAGLDESLVSNLQSLSSKPEGAVSLVASGVEIYLPLEGAVNVEEDKARLEKELAEAQSHIERLEKLFSSDFANKAPAAVIGKEREKLAAYKETAEKIKAQLK